MPKTTQDGKYIQEIAALPIPLDVVISGQITVATAGTAVQGPNIPLDNGAWVKALPGNTGNVAYGNDGADDVTMLNGYVLAAGDPDLAQVTNLNELWFDSAEDGDKFCWKKA